MGFNGNRNNADGRDPDFGAIFMSNSGTKRECFKRRLFGLPSPEIHFVEQVKAGMILFLFEYEKRQLHGVFKASCDGAMNIVPNAFSSSGKQFPAQVKFSMIWHCKPLPESLFRAAIRENYFSAYKFNFGLSEKQVYKLLKLFGTRKLELEVPRPTISGGYSKSPSDIIRVDGEDSLSVSDGLMSEDPRKNGERMVFSADSPHLHHSNVNPSVFYGEPVLESNYLVQNQIRSTSAMIHPIHAQILDNSCATQGDASSKNPLLYDPDDPGLDFSKPSFIRINNDSRSVLGSASPSHNCRWNSLSDQPRLMHTELEDMNRCHHVGYGFPNCCPYGNGDCMPFNVAQNSDQLAAESVAYGAGNSIPSLKSSPAPVPPPDISGRVHSFPSLFHNYKSCVDNDAHPMALRQNLGHEMTLQKNVITFSPSAPWKNEGHFPVEYGDPSIHEYDIEYHGNLKNNNPGYLKQKGSVFSRLSYVQDVSKQENGNNARIEEHDFDNSVDEVMEMVCKSHSQWLTKRKPKPLVKRNKAENLRDKTKTVGSNVKSDCFENTLKNLSMDLTTASECNTNETAEEICFVDFKRRSKVRKLDEIEIRSPDESEKSEKLVPVSQKRRKLIRPNFRKSTTSGDKGINLDPSQNLEVPHESYNLKDFSGSCCSLVHTEGNIKTDIEAQDFISLNHFEDKSSSDARGYVCNEEGGKARDGALTAFDGGSESLENTNNQDAFSPASCKDKSCHIKNLESLLSICRERYLGNAIYGRGESIEERMSKDGESSFTTEVKDGSDCFQKSGNEKAPIETHCHIKEGLSVDSIKSICKD